MRGERSSLHQYVMQTDVNPELRESFDKREIPAWPDCKKVVLRHFGYREVIAGEGTTSPGYLKMLNI